MLLKTPYSLLHFQLFFTAHVPLTTFIFESHVIKPLKFGTCTKSHVWNSKNIVAKGT